MKLLSMNCRGLGWPEAVQEVRSFIQLHRPTLVFLSETRLFNNLVDGLKRDFGLPNGIGVGTFGRGGGLALLWTHEVCVKLQSYDKLHIDVMIVDQTTDAELWRFTGFYGEARRERRHRSWELMEFLSTQSMAPWFCAGDFNEILDAHEQFGGVTRPESQMDGFRNAVSMCGFTDLGFIGLPYTWDNRQQDGHNIKVQLDRAFANEAFSDMYRETKVWHVQTTESDHCCLIIECNRGRRNRGRKRRNFRYENMWRRDPSYTRLVQDAWGDASDVLNLGQLQSTLGRVQSSLQVWEHEVSGSVRQNLAHTRKELEAERRCTIYSGPSRRERQLMSNIAELLAREETMEKQRSRINWMKEGDRNTKFFQARSKERAKCNQINALRNADGVLITDQKDIEDLANDFYMELFTAQPELDIEGVLAHVPVWVTDQMNETLDAPFTAQEVNRALSMMGASKAPGPDGFTAGFFQHHWETVGPGVTTAVLHFLNGGAMPEGVNQTTIVLIPKIKNPQDLKNFRPILAL
jgi:hypothetical protein